MQKARAVPSSLFYWSSRKVFLRARLSSLIRTLIKIRAEEYELDYFGDVSFPDASLIETKILINSIISDSKNGSRFSTLDIKDQFLQSVLHESEYMRTPSRHFFKDIRTKYNIDDLIASDGYPYCKIIQGIHGLNQVVRLVNDKLKEHLAPFCY